MTLKERIIDETTKMFMMYGIKAIRMDDIASNLGISKRTIYEIFGDKETLIYDCIEHYQQVLHERKKEKLQNANNIIEEFLMLLDDWETDLDVNFKLMENIRKFYPKIYNRITEEHSEKGFGHFREQLKQGVKDGLLLGNINYDLAVAVFSYSIFGIMSKQNNMILPNSTSEVDAFRYVITYFFRGVATDKGIKMIDEYMDGKTRKTEND